MPSEGLIHEKCVKDAIFYLADTIIEFIRHNYSQLCLIKLSVTRNFANSSNIFRSLENLRTKCFKNSNLCHSNSLQSEHFYDPAENSNCKELSVV